MLVVACADGEDRPPPSRPSARYDGSGRLLEGNHPQTPRPNVILVCLDTVRADAAEAKGADEPSMKALAAFCARNTRFVDASGPAAWTMPSITTLLTGLSPEHHGCHGAGQSTAIVQSIATLSEYLRGAGYATAAFSGGGWISLDMGFGQGFDAFTRYDTITLEDGGVTLSKWIASVDRAKPYFLFVHSYEAHDPYGRKRPTSAGAEDPAFVANVKAYIEDTRRRIPTPPTDAIPDGLDASELFLRWRTQPLTYFAMSGVPGRATIDAIVTRYVETRFSTDPRRPELEGKLRDAYIGGLKRVDDGFATLLSKLEPVAPPASTIVVVTSDHGEAFGEQGVIGHGRSLIDVLTRVLIAVRAPGRMPPGAIRGGATHADVVPTILELCGMPVPDGIDGVSLVPMANGRAPGHPVEAEEYRNRIAGTATIEMRLFSVRDEHAKFVATLDTESGRVDEERFDLALDPAEANPLSVGDLSARGAAFVAAVTKTRARIAAIGKQRAPK